MYVRKASLKIDLILYKVQPVPNCSLFIRSAPGGPGASGGGAHVPLVWSAAPGLRAASLLAQPLPPPPPRPAQFYGKKVLL